MAIRVLIADDNEIVRLGVRTLLSDSSQWEVCGEAADGLEAIEKVSELSPNVVILDLIMPTMSGYEAAPRIREISPSTKIVVFSIHDVPTSARLAGADAFVSKSSIVEDLTNAIRTVVEPR